MRTCEDCGHVVEPDPDGSVGVYVHDRWLGTDAVELDSNHAARPPETPEDS